MQKSLRSKYSAVTKSANTSHGLGRVLLPTFGEGKIRRSILLCKNELLEVPGEAGKFRILEDKIWHLGANLGIYCSDYGGFMGKNLKVQRFYPFTC